MAELIALQGGAGLASSIITFIEFSIKFGELVKDVAKTQGGLPRELEECQEDVDIVVAWLGNIQRSVSDSTSEDELLKDAIRRCSETSNELIQLLERLCRTSTMVQNTSLAGKTRAALGHVGRAGKIHWKRDLIAQLRDKLRVGKDDVHACLGSSTDHNVRRIFNEQLQIGVGIREIKENLTRRSNEVLQVEIGVRELNEKLNGTMDRLYELELKCQQITTQNHQIMNILLERRRGRVSVLAVVFDYLPEKPLITSTLDGIRYAATTLSTFKVISSRLPIPEDFVNALVRRRAMQVASMRQAAKIDVLVSLGKTSIAELPATLHATPQAVTEDFTVAKALQGLKGSSERLSALKTTTRVVLAVFSQNDGYLPLLDTTNLQSAGDTQRMPMDRIPPPTVGQPRGADYINYEEAWTPAHVSLRDGSYSDVDHQIFPGSQLVLFIERDWSITARTFCQLCLMASLTRLATIYGYMDDGYYSQISVLSSCITFLCSVYFLEHQRQRMKVASLSRVILALAKLDPLWTSLYLVFIAGLVILQPVGKMFPELRHNHYIILPLLGGYYSLLSILTLHIHGHYIASFPKAVWGGIKFYILDQDMRQFYLTMLNLFMGLLSALNISQNVSLDWQPGLAPVTGAAFFMVSILHTFVGVADGTTTSQFLQLFYPLCMIILGYAMNSASTWPFYLGIFISYLVTGPWITRRWFRRRREEMRAEMNQNV